MGLRDELARKLTAQRESEEQAQRLCEASERDRLSRVREQANFAPSDKELEYINSRLETLRKEIAEGLQRQIEEKRGSIVHYVVMNKDDWFWFGCGKPYNCHIFAHRHSKSCLGYFGRAAWKMIESEGLRVTLMAKCRPDCPESFCTNASLAVEL